MQVLVKYLHLLGVTADQKLISTEFLDCFLLLPKRRADDSHFSPESLGEFHSNMTEATKTDNANSEAGFVESIVPQGAVSSNAGTEERSTDVHGEILGPTDDEVLVGYHEIGVASVCDGSIDVRHAVCEYLFRAVVFQIIRALIALAARSDQASNPYFVSNLESIHVATYLSYYANNLMPTSNIQLAYAQESLQESPNYVKT